MKLKNHPGKYVKRSDLPGRSSHVKKAPCNALRKPMDRDFSKVEIDSNFYFTWHQKPEQKNRP
jgi:hypothetical protein